MQRRFNGGTGKDLVGEAAACSLKPVGSRAVKEPNILLECARRADEPEEAVVGRGGYVGVRQRHFGPDTQLVPA